jgi:hypothetical protein
VTQRTRASHGTRLDDDVEALALATGILGVVLILCLIAAIWPEAITAYP